MALRNAIHLEDFPTVYKLLTAQEDPNKPDKNGCTPLHLAALLTNEDYIVRSLLQHGADIHATDVWGDTPLHYCTRGGTLQVLRVLLEYGADMMCMSRNGMNALGIASKQGRSDVVQLLLQYGACVNARNKKGETALHLAVRAGSIEVVSILLSNGANVNAQNDQGDTALHLSSFSNLPQAIASKGNVIDAISELLIQNEADFYIENVYGIQPIQNLHPYLQH